SVCHIATISGLCCVPCMAQPREITAKHAPIDPWHVCQLVLPERLCGRAERGQDQTWLRVWLDIRRERLHRPLLLLLHSKQLEQYCTVLRHKLLALCSLCEPRD